MTLDKGYDRFGNLKLTNFLKVACGRGPLSSFYDDVFNFGWQNQKTINYMLNHTNLCIYPSRQIDADPIIVKQALALNKPVFISNNNAHSELIISILGNKFVISDWSIVDDDYITDALNSLKNNWMDNIHLYENINTVLNNYNELLN